MSGKIIRKEKLNAYWQEKTSNFINKQLEKISMEYKWENIPLNAKDRDVGFSLSGESNRGAVIYRWVILKNKDKKVLYVGETEDLNKFNDEYGSFQKSRETRGRVIPILWALSKKGYKINLETLKIHRCEVKCGEETEALSLQNKKDRSKIENLFIQLYSPPLNKL